MSSIHPTAIVAPGAEIAKDVTIGPFCIVHPKSRIGRGSRLESHVIIGSPSTYAIIGEENIISPGAVVGGPPQDLKYNGESTSVIVGNNNRIREFCTLNAGTENGGGKTTIGDHCLIMSYVHLGHDCKVGSHVVIGSGSLFGGHGIIEDHVKIGGVCSFNQFIRLGRYAFLAGDATVNKDILPYTLAQGNYAVSRGTNKVGLERAGFSKEEVNNINRAIRILIMGSDTIEEALERIEEECTQDHHIEYLMQFVRSSERGIAR